MASIPGLSAKLVPIYPTSSEEEEGEEEEGSPSTKYLISSLNLQRHIEGGYFAELDRNPLLIPNPFLGGEGKGGEEDKEEEGQIKRTAEEPFSGDDARRNASTSIYYLLSKGQEPMGRFHRNRARTIHTLISGRGRYVLIHADEPGTPKRVESFVVGMDFAAGERSVWVVEGGKYKASFLLEGAEGGRLLISETVIPGFEYSDHDFLTLEGLRKIVSREQAEELEWLVRRS